MNDTARTREPGGPARRLVVAASGIVVVALLVTLAVVKPAMPDRITLLAGPAGGADHELALAYAQDLRSRGLACEVIATDGELDALRRVMEDTDAIAILPASLAIDGREGIDTDELVTLGAIGYAPVWLFHRDEFAVTDVRDLVGRTVATASEQTAGHQAASKIVEANGLSGKIDLRPIDHPTADTFIDGLNDGAFDAVFLTGSSDSDLVEALLHADGIRFASFERAEAYAVRVAGLIALTAPEGVLDLARNVPSEDAILLASTDCFVAHRGLHPAIPPLLLTTAGSVHRENPFSTSVTFPNPDQVTLPLDPGARRYFDRGETGLTRFLRYDTVRWATHLGYVVLPLLVGGVVLLKAVPTGLRLWSSVRLKRLFKQLEVVEKGCAAGVDRERLLGDLDRIDRKSVGMFVPVSTVQDYIDFRQFLHDMRDRVGAAGSTERPGT